MNQELLHELTHALIDSLKVFGVVIIFYIILSFFEHKLSHALEHNKKISPLLGASFGIIPQCGFSIIASDLYLKQHITMGTLLATFIACSDEALPLLFSSKEKIIFVIPLLLIKFILGFVVGFVVDLIYTNNKKEIKEHFIHCEHQEEIKIGCCHHHINDVKENKLKQHLLHPFLHSLKIFLYVLVINIIFALLIYFIGEENLNNFLLSSKYITPLLTTLVGLIPNCASSVIITNLFINNSIGFGALASGLIVNAGLGMIYLLKDKHNRKHTIIILAILVSVSLITGYVCTFIYN